MSHFTTIQTQIRDLEAMNDACVEMDLQLVPNATCRGYAGMTRKAPHVITNTVPLAQLMDGQISGLRHWAKGRARRRNGRRVQPEAN
jgi:hypothetical protein